MHECRILLKNCVFWLSGGKIEAIEVFCEAGGVWGGRGTPRHDCYRTARYLVMRCDEKAYKNIDFSHNFMAAIECDAMEALKWM